MHDSNLDNWQHSHTFGQDFRRSGERRTVIVIVITGVMMLVEIVAGIMFGSMALLADGLHMASHAAALSITAFAYIYARRHADDRRFSFGTGKVNALGGYSGAILLAVFALLMGWESVSRLLNPVDIVFNQAIFVAVLGLAVNGISVLILGGNDHDPLHDDHRHGDHGHVHHHDHNLRSAYLHVLADALTSILAILALLAGKYFGSIWMDPLMGILGAVLVGRWSVGLLRCTTGVLLDRQGPADVRRIITESIECDGDSKIADLHLWSIGPNISAAVLTVVAHHPLPADGYRARLPANLGLKHISIEIHQCPAKDKARTEPMLT
jgi:cation diffusion facilitator family transporter